MLSFDVSSVVPCNALHPGTFLDTPMVRESGITPLGTAQEGADAIWFTIDRRALPTAVVVCSRIGETTKPASASKRSQVAALKRLES